MSANHDKKLVRVSSKVSPRRLRNIFDAIGRRIFGKVHKNEVEYGQTLSKKRRKNCVLKSVSSLSPPEGENEFLLQSPYRINFKFSREDTQYRGSVLNFQKINIGESCCEKCTCTLRKGDSLSRFSISSDSACDVSSESSCDDTDCKYRKSGRTVENFIRIHRENFIDDVVDPQEPAASLWEWTEEEPKPENDPDYDILVTKSGCRVVEPSYENLKLIENLYEMPDLKERRQPQQGEVDKPREVIQSSKTYDEVIESLKLWHLSCSCCGERIDNEFNHCVEGYESLENDFNNDIEEFCC